MATRAEMKLQARLLLQQRAAVCEASAALAKAIVALDGVDEAGKGHWHLVCAQINEWARGTDAKMPSAIDMRWLAMGAQEARENREKVEAQVARDFMRRFRDSQMLMEAALTKMSRIAELADDAADLLSDAEGCARANLLAGSDDDA